MRIWKLREFCVQVDVQFPTRQVLLLIQRVITTICGLLNPIRQVVPLTSHTRLYPPYHSHLHPASLFLIHNSAIISEYKVKSFLSLSMPWSCVNTEYSIHRVQHTPSPAFTVYKNTPSSACTEDCVSSLLQWHGCTWPVQRRETTALYSRLATSLRSLPIILPLYYSTILTSTFATFSTDIPSYEAIHRRMLLHYYRSDNFRYVSHTGFHHLPLSDASEHAIYARDNSQIWECLLHRRSVLIRLLYWGQW